VPACRSQWSKNADVVRAVSLYSGSVLALTGVEASAQSFPAMAVRYIMPLPAGSETDTFARVLSRRLAELWDQQVVVENRPGGGTTIGTEVAAKVAPNGYTVLHAITAHAINATLYPRLSYDAL